MGNVNRLTALQVQKLSKPGYHADGAGLHLCVKASGGKSWIFRYRYGGKEREMGLGPLHTAFDGRENQKTFRHCFQNGNTEFFLDAGADVYVWHLRGRIFHNVSLDASNRCVGQRLDMRKSAREFRTGIHI